MIDSKWYRVGDRADVPPREGRVVRIGARDIAVFNLGDRYVAVDNRCPHKGGPLADGIVAGHTIVCPLHAWKIDLETGGVERPSGANACVARYDVRVVEGAIVVRVPAAARRAGEAA
jgi:nitrite reductase (NADH) small subunit